MDSNEDNSPDIQKLRDARLRYLKQPLFAYLNINSLSNKTNFSKRNSELLVSRLSRTFRNEIRR